MGKILVTGANGFIGTSVVKELVKNGLEVVAIVRAEESDVHEIAKLKGVEIVYCDLSHVVDLQDKISNLNIEICIHLAWAGSFGDGRKDYTKQLANVKYSMDLLQCLKAMGIVRFVGIGTLAEKEVLNYHPKDGTLPNAVSLYGVAKVTAHFMTKTECNRLGIEHIWCHLSNTYGVGNETDNFVNYAAKLMLNGKRASFTAGDQMYDFIYITDAARGIMNVALKGKVNTSYFVGSTKPRKLKEYIYLIRDTINPEIPLYLGEVPFHGNTLPDKEYDCTKLIQDTGYSSEVDFDEGIRYTIQWLQGKMEMR